MLQKPRATTLLGLVFLVGPTLLNHGLGLARPRPGVFESRQEAESCQTAERLLDNLKFTFTVDAKKLEDNHVDLFDFYDALIGAIEKNRPKNAEEASNMVLRCSGKPYQVKSLATVQDKKLQRTSENVKKLEFTVEADVKTLVAAGIEYSEFERALAFAVERYRPKNAEEAGNMVIWCSGKPYQLKSIGKVQQIK